MPPGGRSALLAGVLLALAGCGGAESAPPNLLLVSLDTLRADALGCYGSPRPVSPRRDALAAEGVLFENAMATSPWTLPSHASLLTGLYPRRHGTRDRRDRLPAGARTLAEVLAERGFVTAAVVNSRFLSRDRGFSRGFDHFVSVPPSRRSEHPFEVVDRALAWLDAAPPEPFFLLVHHYWVHSPYEAPEEIASSLPGDYAGDVDGATRQLERVRLGKKELDAADLAHLRDLYAAGVRHVDAEIGRLLDGLESLGVRDRTVVVVTADHGEELLEHGGVLHGRTFFEEVIRVPLLLRGPEVASGDRVAEPVSIVDVLPTALELLGVGGGMEAIDGRSLVPLWTGARAPELRDRFLFAGVTHRRHPGEGSGRAVRHGRHKLVVEGETGAVALYDLRADPEEREELSDRDPDAARRLLDRLWAHAARPTLPGTRLPEASEDDLEALRALGYAD